MNIRHRVILATIGGLLLAGCADPAGKAALAGQESFALAIEQAGRRVPIRDGQAVLAKEPFTLIFAFRQLDGVLVNASLDERGFQDAAAGKPFSQLAGFSGRQIREEQFNPDQLLTLSAADYHYWSCLGPHNHKFDAVASRNGAVVCRRTVARFADGQADPQNIAKLPGEALYLVIVRAEWSSGRRTETQRQCVKLVFR